MANPNLELLQTAVAHLGDLTEELVFVGGCTTGLLITDEAAADIRATKDVDAIVEALTYAQYINFEERLQKAGFRRDISPDAPICRWTKGETLLDVLPINEDILGFKNSWYADAVKTSESREISPGSSIRVVTPPYFVATKLEAFADRGKDDFLASRDLEDLIAVINGREELTNEIQAAPQTVRTYIGEFMKKLLDKREFIDAIPGHLMPDTGRVGLLINRLREISDL